LYWQKAEHYYKKYLKSSTSLAASELPGIHLFIGVYMFERIISKKAPADRQIIDTLGAAAEYLKRLEAFLYANYDINRELKYPFGKDYGWGYKYSHKQTHLCYVFFESGAITVTLQLGDKTVPATEALLPRLLPKTQQLWASRYPCGEHGGWVHYRIQSDEELGDVYELIKVKKHPISK
jgi:hypothetical protein